MVTVNYQLSIHGLGSNCNWRSSGHNLVLLINHNTWRSIAKILREFKGCITDIANVNLVKGVINSLHENVQILTSLFAEIEFLVKLNCVRLAILWVRLPLDVITLYKIDRRFLIYSRKWYPIQFCLALRTGVQLLKIFFPDLLSIFV